MTSEVPARLPALLYRGEELGVGRARIGFGHDGVLYASDPYGASRLLVLYDSIDVYPSYPIHRPQRITTCLMVEPLTRVSGAKGVVWLLAPYELEARIHGRPLVRVSPLPVKYGLHGGVEDGVVCRYYRSRVFFREPTPGPGEAVLKLVLKLSEPSTIPYVVVHVESLDIYASSDGRLYYSSVEASGGGSTVIYRRGGIPRPGLEKVVEAKSRNRSMSLRIQAPMGA